MSNYICPYVCSYKSPSGFCGYTGGYESCQYKRITGYDEGAKRFCAEPLEAPETINIPKPSPNIPSMVPYYPCQAETCAENASNDKKNSPPAEKSKPFTKGDEIRSMDDEVLAAFFTDFYYDGYKFYCPAVVDVGEGECAMQSDCRTCFLNWLKKEVKT